MVSFFPVIVKNGVIFDTIRQKIINTVLKNPTALTTLIFVECRQKSGITGRNWIFSLQLFPWQKMGLQKM